MKKLLEWVDQKKMKHGQIVVLLAALALFTVLTAVLTLIYTLFISLIYIHPNLIYLPALLFIIIVIITKYK